MIDSALAFVGERLNRFLKGDGSRNRVVVGPLVRQDGSIPTENHNRVILSLVSVEQVRDSLSFSSRTEPGPRQLTVSSPINLNLLVLVASSFKHYSTGLDYLSRAIAFLQAHMTFDRNSDDLPPGIDKLQLTMANVKYDELSHLWNGLGAKYLPSALYVIRMLTLDLSRIEGELPGITDIEVSDSSS